MPPTALPLARRPDTATLLRPDEYDLAVVAFSGGKDSVALISALAATGFPKEKTRLWHHLIDGGPDDPEPPLKMDWPCTPDYCRKVAAALGYRLQFQWRVGGFARELLKQDARTAPVRFEREDGSIGQAGGIKAKVGTRLKFPQVTGDLRVRWCSSIAKIDPADLALNNDPYLRGKTVLFLSGERREESPNRSKYAEREAHRVSSNAHLIHHWRAVIDWPEGRVWEAMKSLGVMPHPAYRMGFSRLSCQTCIFGGPNEWATNLAIDPDKVRLIDDLEKRFGLTIKQGGSVLTQAARGRPFAGVTPELAAMALASAYPDDAVRITPETWEMPAGAFRKGPGPT